MTPEFSRPIRIDTIGESPRPIEIMADPDGVWRCRTIFNCVEACPRDIKITKAIMEVAGEIGRSGVG